MNTLTMPDTKQAPSLPISADEVAAFSIKTILDAEKVSAWRGTLKAFEKEVKAWFAPHKRRLDEAHSAMCDDEKKVLAPALSLIGMIDTKISTFAAEQEKIRLAEQKAREEAARKAAEDAQLEAAAHAEKAGDNAAAKTILEAPVAVVAPVVPKTSIAGAAIVMTYKAQVLDLMTLVKAVAAGQVPLGALEPAQTFLNAQARLNKGKLNYPGVQVVTASSVRSY